MPVRYERDDARRRIVVTMQGPYALPDFLAVIERQQVDHAWAYRALYDLRGMTGHPTSADLRQSMSLAAQADQPRGRVAVVTADPVMYRRACTYAALGRSMMTMEVFRDVDEAERWLDEPGP